MRFVKIYYQPTIWNVPLSFRHSVFHRGMIVHANKFVAYTLFKDIWKIPNCFTCHNKTKHVHTWSVTIAQCCYRRYRCCQCWCLSWCCWYCYDVAIASVILIVDFNVEDIDECCSFSPCGLNTHCTNTEGSYTCECNFGFSPDVVNTDDCGKRMIVSMNMDLSYFVYFISVKWRWLATEIITVIKSLGLPNSSPIYEISTCEWTK